MSTDSVIFYPDYMRIIQHKPEGWWLRTDKMFYKRLPIAIDFQDFKLLYGISEEQVVIELFKINGGKIGYYLANLRHKKYYYCGLDREDVRTTLRKLGIGRADPMEN